MIKTSRWWGILFSLSVAIAILISSVAAQCQNDWGNRKCGSLDRLTIAIRMAEVLYPELKGQELSLQFSEGTGGPPSNVTDVRSLQIVVDKPQWRPRGDREVDSKNDKTPLTGAQNLHIQMPLYLGFNFINFRAAENGEPDLVCRPLQFMNNVASAQMQKARAIINAHPEWTDDQDLEAARKLGLRYGPAHKTDLLQQLPLRVLSSFYGPLQIKNAEFHIAGNNTKKGDFAELRWYIAATPVGTSKMLTIFVEPFHGKIVAISE